MHKILIIEDDLLISRMYQSVFKFEKFDVEIARDGEQGLEKLKEMPLPVIILLDIMMPKMNGIDVLKKIKNNLKTKNIPVIVLTNLAGKQDAEAALKLGAVKFIVKSDHKPKQVVADVREILAASTREAIPETTPDDKD
ncbi:MAG: response regulator [Patescibacteria group bacterium]